MEVTEKDKYYTIELSNKSTFEITGDEKEMIMRSSSQFIELKSGEIINKSFIVSISLLRDITRIRLEDKKQKQLSNLKYELVDKGGTKVYKEVTT